MLSSVERNLVRLVAKTSPWLAPLPSGYFVARAAQAHLGLPLVIAVVVGLIIELLGISSVHTWLWLNDWNINKRKNDPESPAGVAIFLGGVYLVSTISLTVMLEVLPILSIYAPAIFPVLAVVGAINLTLIAQQQQRENTIHSERQESNFKRDALLQKESPISHVQFTGKRSSIIPPTHSDLVIMNNVREQKKLTIMDSLMNILLNTPDLSVSELANQVGCSRTTIYKYLDELESKDRIHRNGNKIIVVR